MTRQTNASLLLSLTSTASVVQLAQVLVTDLSSSVECTSGTTLLSIYMILNLPSCCSGRWWRCSCLLRSTARHLCKRIVYKLAATVYKCLHGLAPPYLAVDCVPVTSLPSQHLRSAESGCLAITGARTTLGSRNFAVAGAKIWNSLPVDLRLLSQSLRTFGHKLKHCLLMSHERIWGFLKSALYKFSHYYLT